MLAGLEEAIHLSAEKAMPILKTVDRSKPWWSSELTDKRKAMHTALKRYKKDPGQAEAWRETRNSYFHALRKAKETYQHEFLASVDSNDIYTAFKFTKGYTPSKIPEIRYTEQGVEKKASNFTEKCKAFLTTMYPKQEERETNENNNNNYPLNPPQDWPDL